MDSHKLSLLGDFEEVKLCDFGVSLDLTTARVEDYVGTGAWMAPEALEDEGPVTEKADIFSLGLVIWEMLTLKIPNTTDDYNDVSLSESFNSSLIECDQHYGRLLCVQF